MKIQDGDLILILSPDNKTFLVKAEKGRKFHTHKGIIDLADTIGRNIGEMIYSSLDHQFYLLEPTVEDRMMKVRRLTQIIYPKDAAMIIMNAGIRTGMRVIECGIGSGAFTIVLSEVVSPHGIVYAYEKKEEFMENALRNIEFAGFREYVHPKIADFRDGFDEREIDAVLLDIPFPWEGIPQSAVSLKGGGRLASVSPTMNQVEKTVETMKTCGFVMINTKEILMRNLIINTGRSRPADRMIGHTAYITTGRKTLQEGNIRDDGS